MYFIVVHLVAAIVLLLWAVRMVRTAVERAYSAQLKRTLARAEKSALAAASVGAVMAIVALMFVIEQLAGILFTKRPVIARPLVDGLVFVGDSFIEYHSIMVLVVAVVVFACVDLWMRKGRYGRMLRAVGDNEDAARILGLPIRRIKGAAVLVTGIVCAIAGTLLVTYAPVNYHSHIGFAVLGFVALVIGGMGSAWAPLAGGLILGVIEATSNYLLGGGARDYVLLALVLFIFAFWPAGLFHVRVRA